MEEVANITDALSQKLSSSLWNMPPELLSKFSLLFTLAKVLFIVTIIYFILLIIAKIFAIKDSFNLKAIARNTAETNDKLSMIISQSSIVNTSNISQKTKKSKLKGKEKDKDEIKINHFP